MFDLSAHYLICRGKIEIKSQFIKSSTKHKVDTYGAPSFAPDNSATILVA